MTTSSQFYKEREELTAYCVSLTVRSDSLPGSLGYNRDGHSNKELLVSPILKSYVLLLVQRTAFSSLSPRNTTLCECECGCICVNIIILSHVCTYIHTVYSIYFKTHLATIIALQSTQPSVYAKNMRMNPQYRNEDTTSSLA